MKQSTLNLKSYCKKNKVKQPKEPYLLMSYPLKRMRNEVLDYLHKQIDAGRGCVNVMLPADNSTCRLFSEKGRYCLSSDKLGVYDLEDLSTDFLGEQLYYSIEKESSGRNASYYEYRFDIMKDLQVEWMQVIISNKEKRISLETSVPIQFSGYFPGEMRPGTISAVYEKEGKYYVCMEGQDDICWDDLNIDTKVKTCDEIYSEFLPQITPPTIEEAAMLMALECKNKLNRMTLASNANIPADVLAVLSEDKDEGVRQRVAQNKKVPVEILSKLADDPDISVLMIVAQKPNTPANCLAKLAEARRIVMDFGREKDSCEGLRRLVAKNPNTPVESLAKLAEDPSSSVREATTQNPNSPTFNPASRVQNNMESESANMSSRDNQETDSYPDTPADVLARMALDPDYKVRKQAAANPNTPAESLALMSNDSFWDVVEKVAMNPKTPLDTLLGFANHAKHMELVVKNPMLPLQTLLELAGVSCYYPKELPAGKIINALLDRV